MKFGFKVIFSTILVLAVSFCVMGYLLIDRSFRQSLNTEIKNAAQENQLIIAATESEIINMIYKDEYDSKNAFPAVGKKITENLRGTNIRFVFCESDGSVLYQSTMEFYVFAELLMDLPAEKKQYTIEKTESGYDLLTASILSVNGVNFGIINLRDINTVFLNRDLQVKDYLLILFISLAVSGGILYLTSYLLTLPITRLNRTSARIASGEYDARIRIYSNDEVGEVAKNFNTMARSVEEHVEKLTDEVQRRKDFVANFTHELKTPLTSVIGYADRIRSSPDSGKDTVLAANYIFTEGMRLETMSMKLFDLFLSDGLQIDKKRISVSSLFSAVKKSADAVMEQYGVSLRIYPEELFLMGDFELLRTALINLCDNAAKASERGQVVNLRAEEDSDHIILEVEDHGRGIPEKEIHRITEPFYMVDKSRTRSQGGAGLGMSLVKNILSRHHAQLQVLSEEKIGTTMRLVFLREEKV